MKRQYIVKVVFGNGTWFRCPVECKYFESIPTFVDINLKDTFGAYNKDIEVRKRGGIVETLVCKGEEE